MDTDFDYKKYFGVESTGYETLLYDVMIGDANLFKRADMIETGWAVIQPILNSWSAGRGGELHPYGRLRRPLAAEELTRRDRSCLASIVTAVNCRRHPCGIDSAPNCRGWRPDARGSLPPAATKALPRRRAAGNAGALSGTGICGPRSMPHYSIKENCQALAVRIVIADYDPRWPELYQREVERIRTILGERVLRVEHVGSTSVPGLAAKPVIDILLTVRESGDEAAYALDLERAGYFLKTREPHWHEHRLFKGPDTNINLHVFSMACPEIERMLLFRDRLRTNPADHELYEHSKRRLAEQEWGCVQDYADAKTAVVQEILGRAQAAALG